LRGVAAAAGAVAMMLGGLVGPPSAVACTAENCEVPFARYVRDQPVAVYRFDDASSRWSVIPQTATEGDCLFRGTFVFRRIDMLRRWSPTTLTVRIRPNAELDCPEWAIGGAWDAGVTPSPVGRWIVSTDFWHVSASGRIDAWGWTHEGSFPRTYPRTLAGWYAALGAPDTSTVATAPPAGDTRLPKGGLLAVAAVLGLVLGLGRAFRARSTTT
jgi:hypothetical protein